ncbi:MAG: cation:proton antiporter [Candidatus Omnitrophota bacterium]|nr:cation:proton antiporter [Candidatus Omnitrophota bacterium]
MAEAPLIFQDLFYVWLVGLAGGLLAHLLKQPLLLGYMLGGILISPFTPGPAVHHVETIQHLAEFGVVLLMFSIGLELAPVGLRRIGKGSVVIGTLKTLLLAAVWVGLGWKWGWPLSQSVVLGFALSVSSTMVVTKMLMERKELKTAYGELLVGITIIEDCVMMAFLLFLPLLADSTQWQVTSVIWVIAKSIALLALIFILGSRLVPRLLALVSRANDPELSVLVLLVVALGVAVIAVWCGLSLALGAFVAGLVVSGSETTSHTMGRMLPMRDLFVVTFFVSLGVLLDPFLVARQWALFLTWLGFVLACNWIISAGLSLALRLPWHDAWRVGVGLSQIGEFSIVLCTIAKPLGLIPDDFYHLVVAVSLVSILVNTFVFNLLAQVPSMLSAMRSHPVTP